LAYAEGERTFLIDSDLEEEPELLEQFVKEMETAQADVVFGVQARRKGYFFERLTGEIFFTVFNLLSTHPIPRNVITARIMSKRYVRSLVAHKESDPVIAGLWAITGYKQVPYTVNKGHKGKTTYDLGRKFAILVNSITSFSNKPLILIFYLGCLVSFLSFCAAFYLVFRRLMFGIMAEGYTSIIVSVWLMGGITVLSLGVVGLYVSKIFTETKNRPYTIVREYFARAKED